MRNTFARKHFDLVILLILLVNTSYNTDQYDQIRNMAGFGNSIIRLNYIPNHMSFTNMEKIYARKRRHSVFSGSDLD